MSPPHALGTTLYAEYEAVIAAVIYGLEAAAYLAFAGAFIYLGLTVITKIARRIWR